ncbi:MAG: hypothetical protein HYW48_02415 [Deltaproteobacteria bacterium]|nr:hypothetical protein [Deltaproteobacteria bacterium]
MGPELVATLKKNYPESWGRLGYCWSKEFEKDFEQSQLKLLQLEWKRHSKWKRQGFQATPQNPYRTKQWDLADYFHNFTIDGMKSFYVHLLDKLRRILPDVVFINLNYDTLLLQALEHLKIQYAVPGINSHMRGETLICMPHGSSSALARNGIEISEATQCEATEFELVVDRGSFQRRRGVLENFLCLPAMSYIEPTKFALSGANFLNANRFNLESALNSASLIFLIGVNCHPGDSHIWVPIGKSDADCVFVNPEPSSFCEWIKTNRKGKTSIILSEPWGAAFERVIDLIALGHRKMLIHRPRPQGDWCNIGERIKWIFNPTTGKGHRSVKGFCLFFDILGYSPLMSKSDCVSFHIEADNFFVECIQSIPGDQFPDGKIQELRGCYLRISDTGVIWTYLYPNFSKSDCFNLITTVAKQLLVFGFKRRFALRGAIAFGDCVNDIEGNSFTGTPWIEAHKAEQSSPWAGMRICSEAIEDLPQEKTNCSKIKKWKFADSNEILAIDWVTGSDLNRSDIEDTFDRIPIDEKIKERAKIKKENTLSFFDSFAS